jgi:hypothetical protein
MYCKLIFSANLICMEAQGILNCLCVHVLYFFSLNLQFENMSAIVFVLTVQDQSYITVWQQFCQNAL